MMAFKKRLKKELIFPRPHIPSVPSDRVSKTWRVYSDNCNTFTTLRCNWKWIAEITWHIHTTITPYIFFIKANINLWQCVIYSQHLIYDNISYLIKFVYFTYTILKIDSDQHKFLVCSLIECSLAKHVSSFCCRSICLFFCWEKIIKLYEARLHSRDH